MATPWLKERQQETIVLAWCQHWFRLLVRIFQGVEYWKPYAFIWANSRYGDYGTAFYTLQVSWFFHVCLGAIIWYHVLEGAKVRFTADDHFGFEAGSWYWHFVDVVWICLVAFVYVM